MKRALRRELKARVDDRTRVYIEEIAEAAGLTPSDIVRQAIRQFIQSHAPRAT